MRFKFYHYLLISTLLVSLFCFYTLQMKLPYGIAKNGADMNIAIVIVLEQHTKRENYKIAIDTVECYAKIQSYAFIFINETEYSDSCKQPDHLFRRHCVVAQILPKYDAVLFVDGDTGVVNPKRRIEEFMDDSKDLIFFERFYNWEIQIGTYIARNTKYARNGLLKFANYNYRLPNSFHGTDNGIFHLFLVEFLFPKSQMAIENCQKVYNKSKGYDDLFTFQACTRAIMGTTSEFGKLRIIHKGKSWVRDNWLSNSKWSPDIDFMIHCWKQRELAETPENVDMFEGPRSKWYNPLAGEIDLRKCESENSTWNYDSRLIGDSQQILKHYDKMEERISFEFVKSISRMMEVINRNDTQ